MKIDLKRERAHLYGPPASDFVEVVVPPLPYLAIDGAGDPNTSPDYVAAVSALYASGYTLKFAAKARGFDFVVGPLEGLWTSDDPGAFTRRDKDRWHWTMVIPVPVELTGHEVEAALTAASGKKPDLPIGRVRHEVIDEGLCLQIMHRGSYDDEGPTLARLHDEVMPGRGLTFNGHHHEIYLSDPRRVPPERMRTVLRQPVRSA